MIRTYASLFQRKYIRDCYVYIMLMWLLPYYRLSPDGRDSTIDTIDGIVWTLTNVATKEQLNTLIQKCTNRAYARGSNNETRSIIPQLEAGNRFTSVVTFSDPIFDVGLIGDSVKFVLKSELWELVQAVCKVLNLECSKKEARQVALEIENAYRTGYAAMPKKPSQGNSRKSRTKKTSKGNSRKSRRSSNTDDVDPDDNGVGGEANEGKQH